MIVASDVLPTPGGAPEDETGEVVAFNGAAKRLAFAENVFLADEIVERFRAEPFGEGALVRGFGGVWGVEQAHER